MKKSFIALSFIFIIACSNSDMNGYTDSIIKYVTTNNLNPSSEELNKASSESHFSTLENDLTSLDEDTLVEMLLNTSPKYLAKEDENLSSQNSSSNKLINQYDGDILGFNTSDFLKEIDAKSILPFIEEPANYEFGFDNLPKECYKKNEPQYCYIKKFDNGNVSFDQIERFFNFSLKKIPVIYISVGFNKNASFRPNQFTCNKCLYEKVQLIQLKTFNRKFELEDLKEEEILKNKETPIELSDGIDKSIPITSPKPSGLYLVVGKTKARPQKKDKGAANLNPVALIAIIPYALENREFTYIQLDGDDKNVENEENSFNLSKVTTYTKKIVLNPFKYL